MKAFELDLKNTHTHTTILRKKTVDEPNDEISLNDKNIYSVLELVKRKVPNKYNDVKDTLKGKIN